AEDGIRDFHVTGVQTCALPIYEVFLDEVRVPADLMLGPPGEGFQALLNGLDADRFWGRFYKAPALARVLRQLVDYANTTTVGGEIGRASCRERVEMRVVCGG